ncbi:NAD(P)H-binding protein [Rhizobium mesosinicum]|uniref:NAD(P)H-binding protein n=1 Tax=Rhizobium mesosinicum TaxID=335017 RepID=A0ABS7GXY4_9HYPH|nr:NAD(P)H-binding protein [Rhizobium mesosinicum]MBW9054631.1 NAD(P)H-binding protein [Rhizobium mesosinicum]
METVFGVTGASGKLARIVTSELRKASVNMLVLGTRNPASIALEASNGSEVRLVDFDKPETLGPGLADIDRLLIISTDHLSVDGARREQHRRALAAAKAAGVQHIAYTSMPNPDAGSPIPFAADHRAMEADLEASGIDHTVLRVSWYFENLLRLLPHVVASGVWYSASGTGRISYLARSDAGRAAARALLAAKGGIVDFTGAAFQTTSDIAAIVSEVTGRAIEVVPVSQHEIFAKWASVGLPKDYIATLAMTDANQREGRFSPVSNAVPDLIGEKATDWRTFLNANLDQLLSRAAA